MNTEEQFEFDVFISHASEDKAYAATLVEAVRKAGIRVWFDAESMSWGDDLRCSIGRGLSNCRYGIVIFSKAFLARKKWTEYELNGLFARETIGVKRILPIWYDIGHADLLKYSPAFADRLAKISATHGCADIVQSLRAMLGPESRCDGSQSGGLGRVKSPERISDLSLGEEFYLLCCQSAEPENAMQRRLERVWLEEDRFFPSPKPVSGWLFAAP